MELIGKCMTMCPIKEVNFRKKHNLLHALEILDIKTSSLNSKPVENCVKEFHRSAAGETIYDLEILRPSSVLLTTTEYLLETILQKHEFSFSTRYDFIFDRLRSVRQDATIQRLAEVDPDTQITLLERCVRFYVYAAHRKRADQQLKIDSHINTTHMNDCFKALIRLYSSGASNLRTTCPNDCLSVTAAYILLNLNSPQVLRAILSQYPKWLRTTPEISCAVKMYFAHQNRNFIFFNKTILELIKRKQYLCLFALSTIIDNIRSHVMAMLCHSHNSKQLLFSCDDLPCWLLLSSTHHIVTYCVKFGLPVVNETSVKLTKNHNCPKPIPCQILGCKIFDALNNLESEELYNYILFR